MIRPRDIDLTSGLNALFSSETARFAGYNLTPKDYEYVILEEAEKYTLIEVELTLPGGQKVKRKVKAYKGIKKMIWTKLEFVDVPEDYIAGPFSVKTTLSEEPDHELLTVTATPPHLIPTITETGVGFTIAQGYSGMSSVLVEGLTNLEAEASFFASLNVPALNADLIANVRVSSTSDGTGAAPNHYLVGDKAYVVVELVGIDVPEIFNLEADKSGVVGTFTEATSVLLNDDTTRIFEYTIQEIDGSSPSLGFKLKQGFTWDAKAETPRKNVFATANDIPTITAVNPPTEPVTGNFMVQYTLTPPDGHWLTEVLFDKPGLNHVLFSGSVSIRIDAGYHGNDTINVTLRTDKGAETTFAVELNVPET